MNKLTDEEILLYVCEENLVTGVAGIKYEYLQSLDLDIIPEIQICDNEIWDKEKTCVKYIKENYFINPRSIYSKPSFGGNQVLMGRVGRTLYFSKGKWFHLR